MDSFEEKNKESYCWYSKQESDQINFRLAKVLVSAKREAKERQSNSREKSSEIVFNA